MPLQDNTSGNGQRLQMSEKKEEISGKGDTPTRLVEAFRFKWTEKSSTIYFISHSQQINNLLQSCGVQKSKSFVLKKNDQKTTAFAIARLSGHHPGPAPGCGGRCGSGTLVGNVTHPGRPGLNIEWLRHIPSACWRRWAAGSTRLALLRGDATACVRLDGVAGAE